MATLTNIHTELSRCSSLVLQPTRVNHLCVALEGMPYGHEQQMLAGHSSLGEFLAGTDPVVYDEGILELGVHHLGDQPPLLKQVRLALVALGVLQVLAESAYHHALVQLLHLFKPRVVACLRARHRQYKFTVMLTKGFEDLEVREVRLHGEYDLSHSQRLQRFEQLAAEVSVDSHEHLGHVRQEEEFPHSLQPLVDGVQHLGGVAPTQDILGLSLAFGLKQPIKMIGSLCVRLVLVENLELLIDLEGSFLNVYGVVYRRVPVLFNPLHCQTKFLLVSSEENRRRGLPAFHHQPHCLSEGFWAEIGAEHHARQPEPFVAVGYTEQY